VHIYGAVERNSHEIGEAMDSCLPLFQSLISWIISNNSLALCKMETIIYYLFK
jgi:hypothetical protein